MSEVDQVDSVVGDFDSDRRAVVWHGTENIVHFKHRHVPVCPPRVGRKLPDVDLRVGPAKNDHSGTESKGRTQCMTDVDSIDWPVEGDAGETTFGKG